MPVNGNIAPKSIVIGVADPVLLWGRQNLRSRQRKWSEVLPGFVPPATATHMAFLRTGCGD
jgi:hypothetical protein